MTKSYLRILDPDISAQERDILCTAFFGKPFSEAVYEMRLNDLKEGVENNDYFILSVCNVDTSLVCDVNSYACEVCFGFARPYALDELRIMGMLYTVDLQTENPANYMYRRTSSKFYTTLFGADAFEWAVTQIHMKQICMKVF